VFVVASARDEFDPAEVLFEREGLRRNTPPSREQGKEVAATVAARFGISRNNHEEVVAVTIQSRMGSGGFDLETETAVMQCFDRQRSDEYGTDDVASTMSARDYKAATDLVAQPTMIHGTQDPIISDIAFPQGRNSGQENVLVQPVAVRRLTPRECERLQGFPDDYTAIPKAADGPRYKALGNSMAVPVMAWIGERIAREIGQ